MRPNFRLSKIVIITRAFVIGLIIGIVARAWMRWVSTDPEFSWSGSIFIVGVFTIFFTAQSIVLVLRSSTSSRAKSRVIRAGGLIFTLPLFLGAGGMMLPSVAVASIALWGGIQKKRGRIFLLALSVIVPLIISKDVIRDFGWTFATLGRILLFLLIYASVIFATSPTVSPFKSTKEERIKILSRGKKIMISLGTLVAVALFMLYSGLLGG
jgi:hypothetical protein